jgi:hypothetical protein
MINYIPDIESDTVKVQDYGAMFVVNPQIMDRMPEEYIKNKVTMMEDEAIVKAVRQLNGEPIVISWKTVGKQVNWGRYEIQCKIRAEAARSMKVFIPVIAESRYQIQSQIPPDTYSCSFCGGYTYNDRRGNCAACGGPRGVK